jgi:transposase-like protein
MKIDEAGGDEVVWSLVRSGMYIKDVAQSFGVSYDTLMDWVKRGGPERSRGYDEAKRDSADALVERGLVTLEEADEQLTSAVNKAAKIADYLKWMAAKRDRKQYGDGPSTAIVVDMGQLHLDALRARGSLAEHKEPVAIPAEIVDE